MRANNKDFKDRKLMTDQYLKKKISVSNISPIKYDAPPFFHAINVCV